MAPSIKYDKVGTVVVCILLLLYTLRIETEMFAMKTNIQSIIGGDKSETAALLDASKWLSESPERIVPEDDRKPDDEITYAAFGTSFTWGSGLKDRDTEPYVNQISMDRGRNYGICASGPEYPTACAYTIMGDEVVDVIIIEYFRRIHQGAISLVARLRARFPDAIIILPRIWDPSMLWNTETDENMKAWGKRLGFGSGFIHNSEARNMVIKDYVDTPNKWQWSLLTSRQYLDRAQEDIARLHGAYILHMEWSEDPNIYLNIGDRLLGPDSFHPSKEGHALIAKQVKALVDRIGVPKQPRINKFAAKDNCQSWFLNGRIGEGLTYSENTKLETMPNTKKYVLTFEKAAAADPPASGWIEMVNTSTKVMYFFIGYMVTGPPPSKYPVTEARREDTDHMVKIDPVSDIEDMESHVVRLINLGEVQPGTNARVLFTPLEETEWPFRVVQAVLTGQEDFIQHHTGLK